MRPAGAQVKDEVKGGAMKKWLRYALCFSALMFVFSSSALAGIKFVGQLKIKNVSSSKDYPTILIKDCKPMNTSDTTTDRTYRLPKNVTLEAGQSTGIFQIGNDEVVGLPKTGVECQFHHGKKLKHEGKFSVKFKQDPNTNLGEVDAITGNNSYCKIEVEGEGKTEKLNFVATILVNCHRD